MTEDLKIHKIVRRGHEWCVTSEDGSRSFGCFPTQEEAAARLRQVEGHADMRHEELAMKTEDGVSFPSDAYAHVPDPDKPSTWKIRLWETPDEKVTRAQVGRAVAALGPGGFRGQHAQVPAANRAAVLRRVRAAWRSVHDSDEEMPDAIRESALDEDDDSSREYQLFDLKDVEIFRAGTWNGDQYTTRDLDDMITAFDQAGFRPPVKIGHREESGDPAYGWVANLRRVGDRLLADLTDLPRAIYDAIKERRFDSVSSEIFWNFKREGKTLRRVLKGVALLGSEIPAVAGLKPLRESFKGLSWESVGSYTIGKDEIMADDPKKGAKGDEDPQAQVAELTKQVEELTAKLKAAEEERKASPPKKEADDSALQIKALKEQIETLKKDNEAAAESRRQAEISNKVREVRIPALRDHFHALYDLATLDPGRTVKFKLGEGDEAQTKDTPPMKVIDDLVTRLNRHTEKLLLQEHATHGDLRRDDAPPTDDPGGELHRLTRVYMAKNGEQDYDVAFAAVLADPENEELKRAYAQPRS